MPMTRPSLLPWRALFAGGLLGVGALAVFATVAGPPIAAVAPTQSSLTGHAPTQRVAPFLAELDATGEAGTYARQTDDELQRLVYADPFAALVLAVRWRSDHPAIARELVIGAAIDLADPQPLAWWVASRGPALPAAVRFRIRELGSKLGAGHEPVAQVAPAFDPADLAPRERAELMRAIDRDAARLARQRRSR